MIYSVRGDLLESGVNYAVVECGGVGYYLSASANTIATLPRAGEEVKLYTYMNVREDAVELFGFHSKNELHSFKLLISISGVGPKAALSILSDMTPEKMTVAIAAGDARSFTQSAGVGMKTASRIVLELKDKITNEDLIPMSRSDGADIGRAATGNIGEATAALIALGYTAGEAASAASKYSPDTPVNEIIKGCLKDMSKFR